MDDTNRLIATLSAQATAVNPLRPQRYAVFLLCVLGVYAFCAQCWLEGFRPDLAQQLMRPGFVIELFLLAFMLVSSCVAVMYAMVPDGAHRRLLLRLPYFASGAMLLLLAVQLLMPHDPRMVMPTPLSHARECTIYIGYASLFPAIFVFALLRRGASVVPMQAGLLAVIASVSVGALTLRLAEANDAIMHLLVWHYAPSLFFAVLGASLGRLFLRW